MLNNVGVNSKYTNEQLFHYIQKAFKMTDQQHEELLGNASTKVAPKIRLKVVVIEARDLMAKDTSGLFSVTMYIQAATRRYTTSTKADSVNPSWEEYFLLYDENSEGCFSRIFV